MKTVSGQNQISFAKKVWEATKLIPRGRVATYQDIAGMIRHPRAARAVGNALNKNRSKDVPCHRIVHADGSIGGFAWGRERKRKLLENERILFRGDKIDSSCMLVMR